MKKIPQKQILEYNVPEENTNEETLRIPLADKIEAAKQNKLPNLQMNDLEESNATLNDKIEQMMNNNPPEVPTIKKPLMIEIDDQEDYGQASYIKNYMAPMFTPTHYKGIGFNPYSS